MGETEDTIAAQPPAQLKSAMRRIVQRAVPDLRTQIVKHGFNRADVLFNPLNQFLYRAIF